MAVLDRIEINPKVMLGKPVIRGTRIPVELLLRKMSEGITEAELLDAYPQLTRDDIKGGLGLCGSDAGSRGDNPHDIGGTFSDNLNRRLER